MNSKGVNIISLLLAMFLVLGGSSLCQAEEKTYLVGFKQPPGQAEKAMVQDLDGKVKRQFKLIKAMAVKLSEKALTKLKAHPKVAYVEEDATLSLVTPLVGVIEYENSWGVARIGSLLAHDQGILGGGVKIAVLDTGIAYNHPELIANYRGGDNFVSLDPNFHDPFDDSWNSHGTHVAGIIAAQKDGVGTVGVAPAAEIYAVKVLDGAGFGPASSLIGGLEWAVNNQMQVVNMSVGFDRNLVALEEACQAASDAGIILIAAAGNTSGKEVLFPARYDSVIAVSATDSNDLAPGLGSVGAEVELAAPGIAVNSTVRGGGYDYLSGTSQAAPHVAGIAALAISARVPDIDGDGQVDHRDIRLQLQSSVYDLGEAGRDPIYGYGLALASAEASAPMNRLTVTRDRGGTRNSVKNLTMTNGIFELRILNHDLASLQIETYSGIEHSLETSERYQFGKKFPHEVSLTMDATNRALEILFTPGGKPGEFAHVEVQRLF